MKKILVIFLTLLSVPVWAASTTGTGIPVANCAVGDTYTQTNASNAIWTCINYLGLTAWQLGNLYSAPNGNGTSSVFMAGTNGQNGLTPQLQVGSVQNLPAGSTPTANVRTVSTNLYAVDLGLVPGNPGNPATVAIGSTVVGGPGSVPGVKNVGTGNNAVLQFTLPNGGMVVAAPVFNPSGGTVASGTTLTLTTPSVGASLYTCVASGNNVCVPTTPYAPINLTASGTICAQGINGTLVSPVWCQTYTVSPPSGGGTQPPPGGTGGSGTGIGNLVANFVETDGSVAFKTCYIGSGVCSGGVQGAPVGVPTHTAGLDSPSAGTGTSKAVMNTELKMGTPGTQVQALWTTSGTTGYPTATNIYIHYWVKASYPNKSGARIEIDTLTADSYWEWMMGTQCNADKMLIQVDNSGPTSGWSYTSIPCDSWFDGNYHEVEQTFHRTLGTETQPTETFDTMTIDHKTYVINVTRNANRNYDSKGNMQNWNESGIQFQIDGYPTSSATTSNPSVFDLWIDTARFEIGSAADNNPGGNNPNGGDLGSYNFDQATTIPSGLSPVGSPTIVTTPAPKSTPNAIHFPSGTNYVTDTFNPSSTVYTGQYIYLESTNTASGTVDGLLRLYHGSAELFSYYFSNTSFASYCNLATSPSTCVTAGTSAFPSGAWHCMETMTKISPTAGQVIMRMDGTPFYTSPTNLNTGNTTADTIWWGNLGTTTGWVVDMDNVNYDDTNWPGCV